MCVQLRDQINESKTDDFIRVHTKKSVRVFAKSLLSVKNKQKFYERALTNTSLEPRPQPPIPCVWKNHHFLSFPFSQSHCVDCQKQCIEKAFPYTRTHTHTQIHFMRKHFHNINKSWTQIPCHLFM